MYFLPLQLEQMEAVPPSGKTQGMPMGYLNKLIECLIILLAQRSILMELAVIQKMQAFKMF